MWKVASKVLNHIKSIHAENDSDRNSKTHNPSSALLAQAYLLVTKLKQNHVCTTRLAAPQDPQDPEEHGRAANVRHDAAWTVRQDRVIRSGDVEEIQILHPNDVGKREHQTNNAVHVRKELNKSSSNLFRGRSVFAVMRSNICTKKGKRTHNCLKLRKLDHLLLF